MLSALAIMPSADRVPVKSPHSVSPDRPALQYVLFVLPTFNITPDDRRNFVHEARRVLCSVRPSHHGPTMRATLLASAIAATFIGRLANNAVSQGPCLGGQKGPGILGCMRELTNGSSFRLALYLSGQSHSPARTRKISYHVALSFPRRLLRHPFM